MENTQTRREGQKSGGPGDREAGKVLVREADLQQQLAEQRLARVQACLAEVQTVLQTHGCQLTAEARLTPDGRIMAYPSIQVV